MKCETFVLLPFSDYLDGLHNTLSHHGLGKYLLSFNDNKLLSKALSASTRNNINDGYFQSNGLNQQSLRIKQRIAKANKK